MTRGPKEQTDGRYRSQSLSYASPTFRRTPRSPPGSCLLAILGGAYAGALLGTLLLLGDRFPGTFGLAATLYVVLTLLPAATSLLIQGYRGFAAGAMTVLGLSALVYGACAWAFRGVI